MSSSLMTTWKFISLRVDKTISVLKPYLLAYSEAYLPRFFETSSHALLYCSKKMLTISGFKSAYSLFADIKFSHLYTPVASTKTRPTPWASAFAILGCQVAMASTFPEDKASNCLDNSVSISVASSCLIPSFLESRDK